MIKIDRQQCPNPTALQSNYKHPDIKKASHVYLFNSLKGCARDPEKARLLSKRVLDSYSSLLLQKEGQLYKRATEIFKDIDK